MKKNSSITRIGWIDFAKGVAIILMVLGHTIPREALQNFIYVFHMPFFFVMAGFLLNLNKWGGAENFKPFAAKLFKRLLVPYFLAGLLWYPIWFVVCHKAGYLNYMWDWCEIEPLDAFLSIFKGNDGNLILLPLWFLPCLLAAEIIFVKLYNSLNKIDGEIFALAVAFISCIGFNLSHIGVMIFHGSVALAAQIFLLTGVLIRKNNFVERINPKTCATLTLILVFAFQFNGHVEMSAAFFGNSVLFYAGGLAGTLLLMKLSALTTGGKIFSLISDCGRQTMMILVLHPIIANTFYEIIAATTNFPPEEFFKEPIIICTTTLLGVLIPLWIAKRFGKLPVLKYFCV